MSEAVEKKNVEQAEESFVDAVLGGVEAKAESHSPDLSKANTEIAQHDKTPPVQDEDKELDDDDAQFGDDGESADDGEKPDSKSKKDSGKEKDDVLTQEEARKNAQETERKQQDIATLERRLKDTQAAFHKVSGANAELKKQLETLKTKKDGDSWFSEEDKGRAEELEKRLEENESQHQIAATEVRKLEEQAQAARWDLLATEVKKEHGDFDEVCYNILSPMLDPNDKAFNAVIKAEYDKQPDKTPAAAYAFAKKIAEQQEFLKDPEAYKAKIRAEATPNNNNDQKTSPTGKAGLDLINSAGGALDNSKGSSGSLVDAIF